tara:strand:- start:188 stop:514 length:327 start_codon:yes stop_codon:yes gene_type:complete
MKIAELKKIIKETVTQLKIEQATQGGSCVLPAGSTYPGNYEPSVWSDKWETFKDNNNLGCTWVKTKYYNWKDKLDTLQAQQPPKCNPRFQNMLYAKLKHVDINHPQCL